MFRSPGPSWQISVDAPEDLHLALFVRDASGLTVPDSVGPLRDPPRLASVVPAGDRAAAAVAWQAWWAALLAAHHATSGHPPEGFTPPQVMAWRYQPRMAVDTPPDFTGLAVAPALQRAAAQAWREGFRQWWEAPPTAEASGPRPEVPIGGVRGGLLAAIMASSRTRQVPDVVIRLERAMHREVEPFELTIEVLGVRGETATMVSPNHALVPIGLYTDSIRYPDWLRQTIAPLA